MLSHNLHTIPFCILLSIRNQPLLEVIRYFIGKYGLLKPQNKYGCLSDSLYKKVALSSEVFLKGFSAFNFFSKVGKIDFVPKDA